MNNLQDKRGSRWRKWDLHIHSLYTTLSNEYKKNGPDDFIKKIINEKIAVIGLTNYFNFTNEDFYLKERLEKNGVVVFLNLEIRITYQNKDDQSCDIHVVFDPTTKKETINKFLNNLDANYDGSTKKTIELKEKKHFRKATIEFDNLLKKLDEESLNLKNKYLIGFLSRGKGNCRSNTNYKKIVKKSDFIIHSSDKSKNIEEDRNFWLSENKPLLQSSDAHSLNVIGSKFTWIKADKTFIGLKQILCEPEKRIRIQERNPDDSKTKRLIIDHVIYKNSLNEQKIYFNNSLNSIIGKRGNGKSTLLKNLVHKIDEKEFQKRDKKPPYSLKDFQVIWADNSRNCGEQESPKSVFYIPQKFLSSLAYEDGEKKEERNDFLKELLSKNELFKNGIELFRSVVEEKTLSIYKLILKLLAVDNFIKENLNLLKKYGGKDEIKKEIKLKMEEIRKNKDEKISEEEIKNYNEIKTSFEDNKKIVGILKQDKEILQEMKNDKNEKEIFESVFIFKLKTHNLSSKMKEKIEKKLEEKGIENLNIFIIEELKTICEKIKKINDCNLKKENHLKKWEKKIKQNKLLEELNNELNNLNKTINNINKMEKKIENAKSEREQTIKKLVDEYSEFESKQSLIYKTIKFQENFAFLQIEIVGKNNEEKMKKFIDENINTRDSWKNIKNEEDIKNFLQGSQKKLSKKNMEKIIDLLIQEKIIIKSGAGDMSEVLSRLLKNPFEIDYLNSVKTKDKKIPFQNMTGGQKAIAFLELIFRFDKERYPIIIDQPEDDLDATGIATDLVKFIIGEKENRQILIATHSASLLICADAENVIVANFKTNNNHHDFSYMSGSIENADRCNDIVKILEGGRDALKKRMQKLNIN